MINAIIGDVVFCNGQSLVLRAGHIEYSMTVSSQTGQRIAQLESSNRKDVRVLTYLQHKEDEMSLFGFSDEEERQLFLELIKVSGIGPKQALKILSGARVSDIVTALDQNDAKFLSKIPGLGLKTAQKIILALRDKLVAMEITTESAPGSASSVSKKFEDLIVALSEMGYDKKKVIDTLASLEKSNEVTLSGKTHHEQEELLFRLALNSL